MFDLTDPIWLYYLFAFGAALAAMDSFYYLASNSSSYRKQINRRLRIIETATNREEAVADLRRERGIGEQRLIDFDWLNRLIMQSGLTLAHGEMALLIGAGSAISVTVGLIWFNPLLAILFGVIAIGPLPLGCLLLLRNRRRGRFTEQFPEAIDIIVRSLRAGHPVPVSIKMAAREMPDPIGSEFGMIEDEITYGLDLETAVRHLHDRVGQEDLPLFIASVAIQMSSGGKLTEILENLSEVVRLRAKMRRKIKALSAEGRISAIILSATPIVLFMIVNWMSPDFYGKNWDHPWMTTGLLMAGGWMMIGNFIMHRMINFRI